MTNRRRHAKSANRNDIYEFIVLQSSTPNSQGIPQAHSVTELAGQIAPAGAAPTADAPVLELQGPTFLPQWPFDVLPGARDSSGDIQFRLHGMSIAF